MADVDPPLMKKVFYIAKRERKPNIKHHSQADDLRARSKVPEWGVFCHTERLRDHPARLKLVLSDSAVLKFQIAVTTLSQSSKIHKQLWEFVKYRRVLKPSWGIVGATSDYLLTHHHQ